MSGLNSYDSTLGSIGNGSVSHHNFDGTGTTGRILDGTYIDGSWELSVFVEDLGMNVCVRVLGSLSIGGLMHRIITVASVQRRWSDYAIWWPEQNRWLLQHRASLDQCGIQSDAQLMFRRTHGDLTVLLPSQMVVTFSVSYAHPVLDVVRSVCKRLTIRYPEELSLMFLPTKAQLKSNMPLPLIRHGHKQLLTSPTTRSDETARDETSAALYPTSGSDTLTKNQYGTLTSGAGTMMRVQSANSFDHDQPDTEQYSSLRIYQATKPLFEENKLIKPKGLLQKARLNSGWLDSSRSLLEHGIEPCVTSPPRLQLRFKYFHFHNLDLRYDYVRINELYEQARWNILSGTDKCVEDEAVLFAAYHCLVIHGSQDVSQQNFPVNISDSVGPNYYPTMSDRSNKLFEQRPDIPGSTFYTHTLSSTLKPPYSATPVFDSHTLDGSSRRNLGHGTNNGATEEVDGLLCQLEQSCYGDDNNSTVRSRRNNSTPGATQHSGLGAFDVVDVMELPSLQDYVKVCKDQPFPFKRYKIFWVVITGAQIKLYNSKRKMDEVLFCYSLRNCSIVQDVSTVDQKYILRISFVTENGRSLSNTAAPINLSKRSNSLSVLWSPIGVRERLCFRYDTEEQYVRWLAAFRLSSRGNSLANTAAFDKEIKTILEMLKLQSPDPRPVVPDSDIYNFLTELSELCPEYIIQGTRSKKHLTQRIMETYSRIRDLPPLEAKHKYIMTWQRLPSFGRTYFTVLFDKRSKFSDTKSSSFGLLNTTTDELIAICQDRVEVVSPQTGEVIQAWNFADIRGWQVNWGSGIVTLDVISGTVTFRPLSGNCKTIAEFLGGYACLNQRTPDKNQEFDERLFYRLTAGVH